MQRDTAFEVEEKRQKKRRVSVDALVRQAGQSA